MGYLHYVFHCRCTRSILLRVETLGPPFEPPEGHSKDVQSVGIVCPHCKRVRSYSVDKDSANYDPTSSAVLSRQTPAPMFSGWLKCAEENCKTPLALFSPVTIPTDDEERHKELATWAWGDDLRCPNGHLIPKPTILNR